MIVEQFRLWVGAQTFSTSAIEIVLRLSELTPRWAFTFATLASSAAEGSAVRTSLLIPFRIDSGTACSEIYLLGWAFRTLTAPTGSFTSFRFRMSPLAFTSDPTETPSVETRVRQNLATDAGFAERSSKVKPSRRIRIRLVDHTKLLIKVPRSYNTESLPAGEANNDFAARLIRAQEEERTLIARELHDDIGQSLCALNLMLVQLGEKMSGAPGKCTLIEDLCRLSERIADDVQRLSHGLHSTSLDILGLSVATRVQSAEFAKHSDVKVVCEIGTIPRNLDRDIAMCLFRILQESLRNIKKHSRAGRITIHLFADSHKICLQVRDDGVGFDPATDTTQLGLGLISMRERLRLIRGKLTLTSARGNGTVVEASVPLPANSEPELLTVA
jgi:signal transduction histidine kinase